MTTKEILNLLPYSPPFLFADELHEITEDGAKGSYTYKPNEYFYQGHFKNFPITPGVILTETMAQIGVVCLGIYLMKDKIAASAMPEIAFTSVEVDFLAPVFPGEKVTVTSQKKYFRFSKLNCEVEMRNSADKIVCKGSISGIIKYSK
ncbi:MAG TPA: 3-hydroxyacyl-ACP dehydratase FabZ family protein [Ferruginibacter sp.]|nr:3-hydroxyacyl-ACP dehydratase FabZ family protein [Ferruginibacter sp.]